MEKHTPHYKLTEVIALVQEGKFKLTATAYAGAVSLGFSRADIHAVLLNLTRADFYKSMTTHADHREWQDVYRLMLKHERLYLKLTIKDGSLVLVVSFKEL